MNNLKKLCVAISLTIMIAGTAFADCPQPNPGEANGPPCVQSQQLTDESVGQVPTTATDSNTVEDVIVDAVIAGLGSLLTIY